MKEERILYALGKVKESYILEAEPGRTAPKKSIHFRWAAAIAAVIVTLLVMQAPPVAEAVEAAKTTVSQWIQSLFPPKEAEIIIEGETVDVSYIGGGQAPSESNTPGFGIYYDPESFTMVEENGVTYIRKILVLPTYEELEQNNPALLEGLSAEEKQQKLEELLQQRKDFYASLPASEMEIRHLPDIMPEAAAAMVRAERKGVWESVSEVMECSLPQGFFFTSSNGQQADAPVEDILFVSDNANGTYQICLRTFLEAAEGTLVRFWEMAKTFEVIS